MKRNSLKIMSLLSILAIIAVFSLIGCKQSTVTHDENANITEASQTETTAAAQEKETKIKNFVYFCPYGEDPWHIYAWQSAEFFAEDFGVNLVVKDAAGSAETQIKQAKYIAEKGDVDGAIFLAVDDSSTIAAETLIDAGIPTILVDRDCPTEKSPLYIAFGNIAGAEDLAKEGVNLLKNKFGEEKGNVVLVTGPMAMSWAKERLEGAENVFKQYPNIQIVDTLSCDPPSAEQVYDLLNPSLLKQDQVDLIFCAWGGAGTGAIKTLEDLNRLKKIEDPDHIILEVLASEASALQGLKDENVDIAFTQPQNFYGPLAMWLLTKWIDEGKEEMMNYLVSAGETIDSSIIPVDKIGKEHMGVNVFANPFWAPATLITEGESRDFYKHPQLKVSGAMITKDTADEPYWEGNALEIWR